MISRIQNRLDDHPTNFLRKEIRAADAPTEAERRALANRRDDLQHALTATPSLGVRKPLLLLFSACSSFGMSTAETSDKAKTYEVLLSEYPSWAIEDACLAMARGKHRSTEWNGKGIPTTNELIAELKLILHPFRSELHRVRQILDAEVWGADTTPEERERNVREFYALLGTRGDRLPENERLMAEARTERMQHATQALPLGGAGGTAAAFVRWPQSGSPGGNPAPDGGCAGGAPGGPAEE